MCLAALLCEQFCRFANEGAKISIKSYFMRSFFFSLSVFSSSQVLAKITSIQSKLPTGESAGLAGPSHQQTKQVQVQQIPSAAADCSTEQTVKEEAAKILKPIFKCSICLSECKLPAAACASCYAVIGCVHCLEQWIESSGSLSKCPLCRTTADYALVPLVREIANIL